MAINVGLQPHKLDMNKIQYGAASLVAVGLQPQKLDMNKIQYGAASLVSQLQFI